MKNAGDMRSIGVLVGSALMVLITVSTSAQTTRWVPMQVLQTVATSTKDRVAITAIADFPSQHTTGWHTHPGEMIGYIVNGAVRLEQDGRAPRVVNAGESFIIPTGVPHVHTNTSSTPAMMFVTYFVPKDTAITKPLLGR